MSVHTVDTGAHERNLTPAQWGMAAFLMSEAAFFTTLIVAYLAMLGKDTVHPFPKEVLELPLVLGTTTILLASSVTIHLAERSLRTPSEASARGIPFSFCLWWSLTILLGILFLLGTAYEWRELIGRDLTIGRNLFGTSYYTLVGFHAVHVTVGVIALFIVLGVALRQKNAMNAHAIELTSWYWHFVDGVWIVVFSVVYVLGR